MLNWDTEQWLCSSARSWLSLLFSLRSAIYDDHKLDVVPYCCSNDKRCCSGKCCEKEEYCCSQHSPDPSSSPVCCPSSTHCCHNSRGEVVCCPELVKQIWIIIGLILLVYTASKFSRAFRAYCNIVPFEDENTNLLEERDVQKMKYCFFGFDTAALRRGQLRQVLSL